MKKNKRCLILLVLLMAAMMCLGGCKKVDITMGLTSSQLLKANGKTCSVTEAKLYLTTIANEYKTFYGYDMWQGADSSGDAALSDYVKNRTMERIQNVFCMALLADEEGLTLESTQTEQIAEAAKTYYAGLSDAEKKYLSCSEGDIEKAYTRFALADKLYDAMTEGVNLEVSDDEARVMDAQIIYTTSQAKASEITSKLSSGNDFAAVASSYTELPSITQNITRGQYPDEVETAAFALDNEEHTNCITTDDGYYFIKCIDKINQDLTEKNRSAIMEQKRETAFDQRYEAFIGSINLQVNDKAWEKLEVNVDDSIVTTDFFETYNSIVSE